MEEQKEVQVKLDAKSTEILKEVSALHRDSIINLGLRLVQKTNYFKTLTSKEDIELASSANLSTLDSEEVQVQETKQKPKEAPKATVGWDNF